MSPEPAERRSGVRGPRLYFLVGFIAAAASAAVLALLTNIFERQQEARLPYVKVVELDETTQDPAIWGRNFPNEYDEYLRTVDQVRTRYGGSEAVPRAPTQADPRSVVAQSRIEEDPRLKTMWAGYAFAKDFREERGHAYMLLDQEYTERQQFAKQPGACVNCHASMVVPYAKAGDGDAQKGFDAINKLPYPEARALVQHPVSCIDCHDPQTMDLRVTRPAFIRGIAAAKAAAGVPDFDVNRDATRQQMRSFVCGQCHVEYYFKGPDKTLTYPWDKGLKVDQIYQYYADSGFKDWVHEKSGAPVLKAQHPEFEMWNQGVHARSGVACADCHMAYERVGALKVSSHHVRSPLLNINHACQSCHPIPEDELKARAEAIQYNTLRLRGEALDALVALIADIEKARAGGATDEALATPREMQRRAQFYLDFVEAENSSGFHAPQEAARILGEAMSYARQGQIAVRDPTFKPQIAPIPDPTAPPVTAAH